MQWIGFDERVSICHFAQLYLIFLFPTSHVNISVWEFYKTSVFTQPLSNIAKSYMQIKFRVIALFWFMFMSSAIWRILSSVLSSGEKKVSCLWMQYLELFKYSIYVFLRISIISLLETGSTNLKVCNSLKSYICVFILNVTKLFTTDRLVRFLACTHDCFLFFFTLTSEPWEVARKFKYTWGR